MLYKSEELYNLWVKRCKEHKPPLPVPEYGWQAYSEEVYEGWYWVLVRIGYIKRV